VVFSPFSLVAANNVRDPDSPIALGDELTFHDQLSTKGRQVGDDLGSCVIVSVAPEILANCTLVIRLPDGNITGQFAAIPGPAPKDLALTGGTGTYRNVGGEGNLGDDRERPHHEQVPQTVGPGRTGEVSHGERHLVGPRHQRFMDHTAYGTRRR
jgi:hypothetical protein